MLLPMTRLHPSRSLLFAMLLWSSVANLVLAQVERAADTPYRFRGSPSPVEAARQVDTLIAEEVWQRPGTPRPLAQADDYVFLRRATFDLIGNPPTAREIRGFISNKSPTKRRQLVERLLRDEWFGDNWGRYFRDVVLYRRADERALIARPSFHAYLADSLNANKSWDEIARDLIMAAGDVRTDGRTGLIMAQMGRPEETVAELSRVLLGVQIQCAQCHDHPFDRWQREQFHELAAFFPRVAVRPTLAENRSFLVYATDFPNRRRGEPANRFRGTLEHYMPDLEDPAAQGTLMEPTFFVTGDRLPIGATDDERRTQLAELFTSPDNPWFSRAIVQRLWTELVGEGFYDAIDDIGPDRQCHAPQTLDYLAESFVSSGYDVKWLMETIVLSDAYGRKSVSRVDGASPQYLANHPKQLRGDQLFNALRQALDLPDAVLNGSANANRGRRPRDYFEITFGFDPSTPAAEVSGSVPQALQLMNSPLLARLMSGRRLDGLSQLVRTTPDNNQVVQELYLRCLSRPATSREQKMALHDLQGGVRLDCFEDLLWALVNSAEFRHRS